MDPLLSGDVGLAEILIVLLKVVVAFAALLIGVMLMVWFERKLVADMQNRLGPNRAGPFGVLQTLADGIKLFFKEELSPQNADPFVYRLAPYLSLIPAFLVFAVVPIAGNFSGDNDGVVTMFGHETLMQVADPQIGILLVLAMSSVAVYGIMLAGWSSGSKYPLLGSVRATSQMVSYEAALGLSVATVLIVAGSLSTNLIVDGQAGGRWNLWMTGLVPFVVFLIAGTAELNRPPFDLVEAEQELVGGFHTEYTALRFAMFFLAEFMNTVTMSAIIVTLFFGGPSGPSFGLDGWFADYVLGFGYFFAKLLVFLFVFVWFRATLPRLRYDQLMDLGWKLLIPLALGWFLVVAAVKVAIDTTWNVAVVLGVAAAGLLLGGMLLKLAIRSGSEHRTDEFVGGDR
ncbi:MAG: NADH-quinone oxidoreductase subunit NuoH [Microthrixaceae bacterium]|nr:NADH-quinone oxidoreductase subunit NuoH [Microthrixaceae bacterium]MCB1010251.1 NADH-quinone oxidoreductase subunit NuoH [Microthrixaceae bacterium]MCB9387630.1 NADH-quinone oxidoreductase subunit NuoH [Microthrixaceae bacterium]MCO5320741.1 NADH-quinone oxidoreductase subunit NuoH [Microthrixaceae bacterium]